MAQRPCHKHAQHHRRGRSLRNGRTRPLGHIGLEIGEGGAGSDFELADSPVEIEAKCQILVSRTFDDTLVVVVTD